MVSNIYLLDFENYFNRKAHKPVDFVTNYTDYVLTSFANINFNPNDGVNTELVVNYEDKDVPNYLIVSDEDDFPKVTSRWYVIEASRTRAGQSRLILRRDLIADFYDPVINAPAMIARGRLGTYDPYIFNDEGMTFNQIKQEERLLKDETQIPWVVGYVALQQTTQEGVLEATYTQPLDEFDYYAETADDEWGVAIGNNDEPVSHYVKNNQVNSSLGIQATLSMYVNWNGVYRTYRYGSDTSFVLENFIGGIDNSISVQTPSLARYDNPYFESTLRKGFDSNYTSLVSAANTDALSVFTDDSLIAKLKEQAGKIVKFGSGTYKRIKLVSNPFTQYFYASSANLPQYFTQMSEIAFSETPDGRALCFGSASGNSFQIVYKGIGYYLDLEDMPSDIKVEISNLRAPLDDAPYCMFAIPYGSIGFKGKAYKDGEYDTEGNTMLNLAFGSEQIATSIAAAIGEQLSTRVYDIQLLPYCPVRRVISGKNYIDTTVLTPKYEFAYIVDASDKPISVLLWAHSSQFTFDIKQSLVLNLHSNKVINQCYSSRLCSPNYASIYEFNTAKNGGVDYFNVDCAYKPFNPYIHINPNFKNLYGKDFNDPRGLICSGDFSLPRTQDQWATYELNNKNYQNMFNRQIETMDLTHKIQKTESIVNAVAGSFQGAGTGFGAGALAGGGHPAGMAIGAGIGLATSVAGGVMDVIHGQQLRENERAQAFDMFRMGNENIQAMPDTLTKVSAFNPNNKIFPVYETYYPTAAEIEAFENYLKYRGMTVNRIDEIINFIWPDWEFVQASIIRFDDLAEDSHVAYEINNELMKGVYFKQ